MANPIMGEGIIEMADGKDVRVMFNNRALAEAEQQMGKSVLGVAQGFTTGNAGLFEVAHLLRAGMESARRSARAGGRPISMNDAYEVMDAAGFTRVSQVVMLTIAAVLSYDPDNDVSSNGTGEEAPN